VRAFEKAGFAIVRQGKHIVMSNGTRILTIPRHNPVNAFTLGGIVRDAGLTVEQFRELLRLNRDAQPGGRADAPVRAFSVAATVAARPSGQGLLLPQDHYSQPQGDARLLEKG